MSPALDRHCCVVLGDGSARLGKLYSAVRLCRDAQDAECVLEQLFDINAPFVLGGLEEQSELVRFSVRKETFLSALSSWLSWLRDNHHLVRQAYEYESDGLVFRNANGRVTMRSGEVSICLGRTSAARGVAGYMLTNSSSLCVATTGGKGQHVRYGGDLQVGYSASIRDAFPFDTYCFECGSVVDDEEDEI